MCAAHSDPSFRPHVVRLQVRRPAGDSWHEFPTVADAAGYALDLMRVMLDGSTYPLAIWENDVKVWKPFGKSGKLHFASTREALEALSRPTPRE